MTDVTNRVRPDYAAAVAEIRAAYAAIPPGSPVRLAKHTSNLFRFRDPAAGRPGPPGAAWTCPRSARCSRWTRRPGPPWSAG